MQQPLIIYAAPSTGKTSMATALVSRISNCHEIVDGWDGQSPLPGGAIVFTNVPPPYGIAADVVSIADASGAAVAKLIAMKECPFCGSEDIGHAYGTHPYGHEIVNISCSSCGGRGPVGVYPPPTVRGDDAAFADQRAEEMWNKRVTVQD